jgi:hypothetical protein
MYLFAHIIYSIMDFLKWYSISDKGLSPNYECNPIVILLLNCIIHETGAFHE